MAEVPEITPGYETSNARKCLYFGVGIVCLSHRSFNKKKKVLKLDLAAVIFCLILYLSAPFALEHFELLRTGAKKKGLI